MASDRLSREWWIVVAMVVPLLALTMDFFGATVALPAIGRDLDTSTTGLQWTMNAYLLAFAAPLIAVGRLADIVGRRKILLGGTALFAAASVACAAAQADWQLIAGRSFQGVGAAMFYATSLSIVSAAFEPAKRGVAIGIWTAAGSIGSSIGPLVAGFLTDSLSWRWFFLINVPICIAGFVLALVFVPESRDETAGRSIDVAGFLTVTVAMVALVFGIQETDTAGWVSATVLVPLAAAVLLFAAFVVIERRVQAPLVEFGIFRDRNYLGCTAVAVLANIGFGVVSFFICLYLQFVLDYSPLGAGLIFLAFTIPFSITTPIAGKLLEPVGARETLVGGMLVVSASFVVFVFIGPESGVALVVIGLFLNAVGNAFAYNNSTTAAMIAIPDEKAGIASGVLSSARIAAIALGVAAGGSLFKTLENNRLLEQFDAAGAGLTGDARDEVRGLLSGSEAAQRKLGDLAPALADRIEQIVRTAFVAGLRGAMLLCLAVSILGVGAAFLVRGKPRRKAVSTQPARAA